MKLEIQRLEGELEIKHISKTNTENAYQELLTDYK